MRNRRSGIHTLDVLVTGGTSNVGAEVALRLAAEGHHVSVVALPGPAPRELYERRIPIIHADVTDGDQMMRAIDGRDAVVHCAAALNFVSSGARQSFHVNVGGTRTCMAAARRAGVSRFIHMSSVAVYGLIHDRARVNEATPTQACGLAYNDSKRDAEAAIYAEAGRVPTTILRLATVYGRFDRVFLPTVLSAFERDLNRWFLGDPSRPMCMASSDFVAAAVSGLLRRPPIAPVDKYIACEGEPPSHADFIRAVGALVGREAPTRALSPFLVRVIGRVCDVAERLGVHAQFSLPHAKAENALVDAIFDGSALRDRLGLPAVDSLASVLAVIRERLEGARALPLAA